MTKLHMASLVPVVAAAVLAFSTVRLSSTSRSIVCDENTKPVVTQLRPTKGVRHEYLISNRTNRETTLVVIRKSCSCSNVELQNGGRIPPYGQAKVIVSWQVPDKPGMRSYTIVLRETSGDTLVLRGLADVKDLFQVLPPSINFEKIAPGDIKTASFEIHAPLDTHLHRSLATETDSPNLQVVVRSQKRNSAVFDVTLRGRAGLGMQNYRPAILTNDERQPRLVVPISAEHLFEYTSSSIIISSPKRHYTMKVTSSAGRPFKIDAIEADVPSRFTFETNEVAAKAHQISLSFRPAEFASKVVTGKIYVRVRDGNNKLSEVTIPYMIAW